MQAPRIVKVTLNMGVGEAKQDSKMLEAALAQLADIAGQKPNIRRARKSVAAFKLREGMPVGLTVTLRDVRAYEFLDRLISVAIPRLRDFRGLNPKSFDGRGNYNMGIREQMIFPEIDYDAVDQVRGLDVAITTTAADGRRGLHAARRAGHALRPRRAAEGIREPEIRRARRRLREKPEHGQDIEDRSPRGARPSTRPALIRVAAAAGARARSIASSGSAASACASSRTTASSPA